MSTIAIFVPHSGCAHSCAFCDQRSITGKVKPPTIDEARAVIEENLATARDVPQLAFFGGSFTGIKRSDMIDYLELADEYLNKGLIRSIRLSTRPDYIDEEILDILKSHGVTNIELGAQSMDDSVLSAARRGHDSDAVRRAAELINKYSFTLGLQMMTGLPGDTMEKSLYTAREFVRLGAKETRIYPTVIIEGTLLADMYKDGTYTPDTLDEAVEKAAACYEVFSENNVKVLRIGLQNSEGLRKTVVGGAYHDALGEMVFSRVVRRAAERDGGGEIRYNGRMTSKALGQHRSNVIYFKEKGIDVCFTPDESVSGVTVNGKYILTLN